MIIYSQFHTFLLLIFSLPLTIFIGVHLNIYIFKQLTNDKHIIYRLLLVPFLSKTFIKKNCTYECINHIKCRNWTCIDYHKYPNKNK
jgi:hypothetical protein